MKKTIIVCGLIAGLIVSGLMLYSMARCSTDMNFENGMLYGYASMVLAFSLVFAGIKNFRDKYNQGEITFGKAFKIGLFITLIASTMYVISWLIDYYCFIPDFMERYAAHVLDKMRAEGASQTKIDEQFKELLRIREYYKNPVFVVLMTYMEIVPVGLVISLISAWILKKKTPSPSIS